MIHVIRNSEVPKAFKSKEIASDILKYEQYYNRSADSRSQETFSKSVYGDTKETLEAVAVAFKYKCAACEKSLQIEQVVSDSWRPRHNSKGFHNEFSPDHYWWLAYEWRNKYALCGDCNNYKSTWFPVKGMRAQIGASYDAVINDENASLIDPCIDYPEFHLCIDVIDGNILATTEKGVETVELLKLNRKDLIAKRKETITQISRHIEAVERVWIDDSKNMVKKMKKPVASELTALLRNIQRALAPHPQRQYVMVWRQLILNWLKENPKFRNIKEFETNFHKGFSGLEKDDCRDAIYFFDSLFQNENDLRFGYNVAEICKAAQDTDGRHILKSLSVINSKRVLKSKEKPPEKIEKSIFLQEIEKWEEPPLQQSGFVRLYPEKIEVVNFRSISKLSFDFKIPDQTPKPFMIGSPAAKEPWKFLLGENGVGKSSLLQAIAFVLCGDPYIHTLNIDTADILKHDTPEGSVKIWFVGMPVPAAIYFNREEVFCNFPSERINVLGYGSTRVMPLEGTTLQPEETNSPVKVKNLFDYSVSLAKIDKWLLEIDRSSFDHVAKALKDILDLPQEATYFTREKNKIYFSRKKETLNQLSEGYRSVISLSVDIMKSLSEAETKKIPGSQMNYEVMEGIVLIDEISSHLHPRLQMRIVKSFRKAFPKLQFIVTSHDPLCLKGIEGGEVLLLKRNEEEEVVGVDNLPDPSIMRAEQLLTSEFFGLNSTIDPELEILLNTYHTLLAKQSLNEDETKLLDDLRKELKDKVPMGNTLREELMYKIIDESLADYVLNNPHTDRKKLFETTKDKVFSLWKEIDK